MTMTPDNRRKQLLYRAQHRGFKEADLLIGGFASAYLADMSDAEMDEFAHLLTMDDHDLYNWILGNVPAPSDIGGPVFQMMQKFDVAKITAP